MRRPRALHAVAVLVILCLVAGCKKPPKKDPIPKPADTPKEQPKAAPTVTPLPDDKDYASGNVPAAVMEVQTTLDIAGLLGKDAKPSTETQTLTVTGDRGKMVFTTANLPVPKGTELRYNPTSKKYVLVDQGRKLYWALDGGDVGNLLEGGPKAERSAYTIEIKKAKGKVKIAGVTAYQTDAEISFDAAVTVRDGKKMKKKTSKVKVKLSIWHTDDAKYKPAWGKMMVDFLTVPIQGPEGQKVVDKLKEAIKFPVKWSMEVLNANKKDARPFKMVTVAQKLDAREVPRAELASPPPDCKISGDRWGKGDHDKPGLMMTTDEEELKKFKATPGKPPAKGTQPEPTKK